MREGVVGAEEDVAGAERGQVEDGSEAITAEDDAELWRLERARQGWAELRDATRAARERKRARHLWLDDGDDPADDGDAPGRDGANLQGGHDGPADDDGDLARTRRWRMTASEATTWGALAAVLTALPAALDVQLRQDAGMRLVEFRALAWLATAPRQAAQLAVLAEALAISQSHVSRVVGRLEQRGWLRRVADLDDGRGMRAELTATGLDAVRGAAPEHLREVRRLVVGGLPTADLAQLEQTSRRILEAVRPGYCLRLPY
ncbi:hypothetical protein N867_17085 [Actinotalea fermentans ATCC 43279 = JCM 9966 = DSM 3133]|nr:hypothetical protein N867_17085 [Actinotalea fermentans ATCC 43279 = JCM 9966 = DSM 3133]